MTDNWGRTVKVEFRPTTGRNFFIHDLKVDFDVEKITNVEPNKAFIKIYNMNDDHLGKMSFRWNVTNDKYGGEIRLSAGYGSEYHQIFRGAIIQAVNKRVGPDWVTEIEAMTLLREMLQAKVTRTTPYPAGTPKIKIFEDILNDLGVAATAKSKAYARDQFGGTKIKKSITLYGSAAEAMNRLNANLSDYINVRFHDDGVEVLRAGKAINDIPIKIWPDRGLIGTPDVTIAGLNCKCLLRHDIQVGTLISVKSDTVANLKTSGNYVVKRVTHKGNNRDGEFTTSIEAIFPNNESQIMR